MIAEACRPSIIGRRDERGMALVSVLAVVLICTLLAALVLTLAGREKALSALRLEAAQAFYIAEGGGHAARAALMAYMNADPAGVTSVDANLTATTLSNLYAGGSQNAQNPLGILDYLWIDGQRFALGATPQTASETFQVNYGLTTAHLKLQAAGGPAPQNPLGNGSYAATVTISPDPIADASCTGGPCAIHQLGAAYYEFEYSYSLVSTGQMSPFAKRQVLLTGTFSVQVRLQSFAQYALFTNVQQTPSGGQIWFNSNTSFTGPVHTNGQFSFAFFPTFTAKLSSVNSSAWFNNNANPKQLANTENVSSGTRIDAPLMPPATNPQSATPANFTLGAPNVPMPAGVFNQQGTAVGRNPTDSSPVTPSVIIGVIPELTGSGSVPNGIYIPVVDANHNCLSDAGESMAGGVYVQGALDSLTMSLSGPGNSTATYTLVQGTTTTTITVDRTAKTTTVTSNGWLPSPAAGGCVGGQTGPATRTFNGVPKGWQQPGGDNAMLVFVNGNIGALSGTLQQNEQTTIAATGSITISDNIQYQTPPNPSDPASNPTNLLGIYSSGGDIILGATVPNNPTIDAILMAGSTGSGYNSAVYVANYNGGSPRGTVTLVGGMIELYYGPFGTFNAGTGQ